MSHNIYPHGILYSAGRFLCPYCPLSFASERGIYQHIRVKHDLSRKRHVDKVRAMRTMRDDPDYFRTIGSNGGKKSRRVLTREEAIKLRSYRKS